MPPAADTRSPGREPAPPSVLASLTELLSEAQRQLNICNACRYCEGYCAVFPALERRSLLSAGDLGQLANLCHDCRACLYACMYAPPHEFAINPPEILSQVRLRSWEEAVKPRFRRVRPGRQARARTSAAAAIVAMIGLIVALAAATEGLGALWRPHSSAASPYQVISYPALLTVMAIPFAWSAIALARAGTRYWHHTRGPLGDLRNARAWLGAAVQAGELRYLKGGGADCQYPTERPSSWRRYLHGAAAYGFALCLVSTIAAAVEQDFIGVPPPYPYLSVPVITGSLGGIGLVAGVVGLLVLKPRSDPQATDPQMPGRDYNLLVALAMLGATGLASLLFRDTVAFGIILVVHLATVSVCFAVAPYTKFSHVLFRTLALVQDNVERAEEQAAQRLAAEQRRAEQAEPTAT